MRHGMGGRRMGPGWQGMGAQGWGGHRGGQPPWIAGLIQLAQQETKSWGQPQQPRAKRGDVRAAILDVLATGPRNGYQLIQEIAERSGGAWKPSPGSIYPTLSQLEDEGLIEADAASGRRRFRLTVAGEHYVDANPEELAGVWRPFAEPDDKHNGFASLKPEIGKLMSAVWQIATAGSDQQQRDAIAIVIETRRKLYGLLADEDADLDRHPDSRDEAPSVWAEATDQDMSSGESVEKPAPAEHADEERPNPWEKDQ